MNKKILPPSSRSLSRRLAGRIAREQEVRRLHDAPLIALATEPVPLGSGVAEIGGGTHLYIKLNPRDGSVRCFRFRDLGAAREASRVGRGESREARRVLDRADAPRVVDRYPPRLPR